MVTTPHDEDLRQRVTELEGRVRQLEGRSGASPRSVPNHFGASPPSAPSRSGAATAPAERPSPVRSAPPEAPVVDLSIPPDEREGPARAAPRRPSGSPAIDDLIGGRLLAWLGGASILTGLILFLAIAIAHGWIGEQARVLMAGAGAVGLIGAGAWLHDHRGRTEASAALVGAGTAGLFATLVVAGEVYRLIAPVAAIAGCLVVGLIAGRLAVRWAGRVVGALGMLGALASPILVGAPIGVAAVSLLAGAIAVTMATAGVQRWRWLGIGATLICAPQWASWVLAEHPAWARLLVLMWFGVAGIAGALAERTDLQRTDPERDRRSAASTALLVITTTIVAGTGRIALGGSAGDAWLFGLAAAHAGLGVIRLEPVPLTPGMRRLLIALGVVLADVAFGLTAGGVTLAIGWAVAAVVFAALRRIRCADGSDRGLVEAAVLTHVGLTLVRSVLEATPAGADPGSTGAIASVAALATACLASAQLLKGGDPIVDQALTVLGMAAIAALSAQAVSGPGLAIAWALEAMTLGALHRRTGDPAAAGGALGFSALAAAHFTLVEAPPSALVNGVGALPPTLLVAVAVAAGPLRYAWRHPDGRVRALAFASAGATLLYAASIAVVSSFAPGGGAGAESGLLDLGIRQEGQVLVSAMWSAIGLGTLVTGLRRDSTPLRRGGLGLLLIAVAKVFLYDLSSLTSLYRVSSALALGLLLLGGAFAYQRLRPPPPPDIRRVHPSQR